MIASRPSRPPHDWLAVGSTAAARRGAGEDGDAGERGGRANSWRLKAIEAGAARPHEIAWHKWQR